MGEGGGEELETDKIRQIPRRVRRVVVEYVAFGEGDFSRMGVAYDHRLLCFKLGLESSIALSGITNEDAVSVASRIFPKTIVTGREPL